MAAFYLFAITLAAAAAAVTCILCITIALIKWQEGEDMNWYQLFLGIINGILFAIFINDSYNLINGLTL